MYITQVDQFISGKTNIMNTIRLIIVLLVFFLMYVAEKNGEGLVGLVILIVGICAFVRTLRSN